MLESILKEKSYAFAVRVVKMYQFFILEKKEFVLIKQLLRSGTSIGANIAEAQGAVSQMDFSAKISIAYKETLETKYWLSLLKDTNFLSEREFTSLHTDADELAKMLFSTLKSTQRVKSKE